MSFPPKSFDASVYRQKNKDLSEFDDSKLASHYERHGRNEGRQASLISNRQQLAAHISECDYSACLEIGPFDCPVLSGSNVKYFDVMSRECLVERAKKIGRDKSLDRIPFIDFVDLNGKLNSINTKFDLALSAHAIEHQLDLIKHLNEVSNILKENGYYVVICPDKRYCFDHFIPETSIAELIFRHLNPLNNHSVRSVIEHRALTCHNDPRRHWIGDHGQQAINPVKLKSAIQEYHLKSAAGNYIDVHSMQFTPDSFRSNMSLLLELNLTNFVVKEIYPTLKNKLEFFVVLQKNIS
jgi:hypothetical protein